MMENKFNDTKEFTYSDKDYIFQTPPWTSKDAKKLSKFDELIHAGWDYAMSKGYFRYTLNGMDTRIVPGDLRYVLQLNTKRGTQRRRPEHMNGLNMPFDPKKFNFNRVRNEEVIARFYFKEEPEPPPEEDTESEVTQSDSYSDTMGNASKITLAESEEMESESGVDPPMEPLAMSLEDTNLLLINVSPLAYGHILLVPETGKCFYQQLTCRAIRLSLDMIMLSSHNGFRIGFNSLCGLASVNHQHIHGWYLERPLRIENASVKEITSGMHEMIGMPSRAFVFQLHGSTADFLADDVFTVTNYLQEHEIAHNVFMTRGPIFGQDIKSLERTIRVYIWPRKTVKGAKDEEGAKNEEGVNIFNVAVAELAGQVPMYVPEYFTRLTENDISRMINENLLPEKTFDKIRDTVAKLLMRSTSGRRKANKPKTPPEDDEEEEEDGEEPLA